MMGIYLITNPDPVPDKASVGGGCGRGKTEASPALLAWFKRHLHWHDYEMTFVGHGLNYVLVCRCGDVAGDMAEALRKMRFPVWRW
jgi:hypothetical protein